LGVALFYNEKELYKRTFYVIALVIFYFGIALSDCRSAKISYGFTALLLLLCFLRNQINRYGLIRRILYFIGTILISVGIVAAFSFATKAVNTLALNYHDHEVAAEAVLDDFSELGSDLSPDGENKVQLGLDRKMDSSILTLNLRTEIWTNIFHGLVAEPEILCIGISHGYSREYLTDLSGRQVDHAHNDYLNMLLCFGLPGLILQIWFLVRLFLPCWRLCFGKDRHKTDGAWMAILSIAIASLMPVTLVETILFFPDGLFFANLWFFILAGFIFRVTNPGAGNSMDP